MMKIIGKRIINSIENLCVFNIIESCKNCEAKNHWIYPLTDRIVWYVNDISKKAV